VHGWGQWYALAAAVVIVACYLCGRRGTIWAAVVLLSAAEVAATVAVAVRHDAASWLLDQVITVFAVSAAMAGAYRRLRHDLTLRGWSHAREARLRERTRVAAEIHDTLGHDLTLLSLRAGAIQIKAADPEIRDQAAALRAGAAEAIATVRGLVDLLGESNSESDAADVIRRAREAGMTIAVTGTPPEAGFTGRLVTEALSNAARHSPGAPVTIRFGSGGRVEISNSPVRGGAAPSRQGTGLATLRATLEQAGGQLTVDNADDRFRLIARIPDNTGESPLAADYASRRRRLRTTLAAGVLAPIVSLGVVSAGFNTWAAHGATMEPEAYGKLHVGMMERDALTVLPARQAPIRAAKKACRYFTDGNFPLAYGNYEICFRDGRVFSLRDSTGGPA
jgi:signal transduction histidine kinase